MPSQEQERLRHFIAEHSLDAKIVIPGKPTLTVSDAAQALGVGQERIIKSLLFLDPGGEPVLAILRGAERANTRLLGGATGLGNLKLASADHVREITGYPAGGTPPVGHSTPLRTVIDISVMDADVVWGGGGDHVSLLRIRPADIQRLTCAVVADISN